MGIASYTLRRKFWFNGECSTDYGLYTTGDKTFNSVSKRQTKQSVPGRNGDLIVSEEGYANQSYAIKVGFYADNLYNLDIKAANVRSWLLSARGYCRYEDDYHPDVYRLAQFTQAIDFSVTNLIHAETTLSFDCKPQQFLKSGDEYILLAAGENQIDNPTRFESKPVLHIISGTGKILVGDQKITVNSNDGDMYIDCDIEDVYGAGNTNMNGDVSLDTGQFFTLVSGTNNIVIPAGMNAEIMTRWWTL